MTEEQKSWMDGHRQHRAMSRAPGGFRFEETYMLHPDGTAERTGRGIRPSIRQGSFEVGILRPLPVRGAAS